ncbi:uncharacterized protein Z518_06479 [Rhinocladiella mackenziei CBS 650.93]|uniref:Uncharacterized protein n=1 Tax=Rhinocladiella mackenziei CBS 650.93 TaxID=1442369 RepID=A0A0D2FU23_9EURO|nr:uncharacterized protein Z518_06479 [Rhinocladiella mackenziei CBS 650.93]KIX05607.1 hypothetical protein Z518_06479 [Rhinocladiella mackenziei CBS 650.93]
MNASNQEAGQGQKRIPTIQEMESWNDEQLLEWIRQTQPHIFRHNEDIVTFKAAKISGFAFSKYAEDLDFFREIHLPLGVYKALAALASEFSKQNNQPNKTAGQKRKENETDSSTEPPISPKRRQKYEDEDELIQLATEANKRRKAIKNMITQMNDAPDQHSDSVNSLPGAVDKLSDPTLNHILDFPFIDTIPERFKEPDIAEGKWLYMGRTMFKDFLHEVKKVREERFYRRCWLYGTQGFGKSHLLAALVCYFVAQDERVVYLPDCRSLLDDPVSYVVAAMLFAWADDFTTQKKIMALNTEDQIRKFFKSQKNKNVVFVVDQINALMSDSIRNREMALTLHDWVIGFTSSHKAILSSSANCTNDLKVFNCQNSDWVVPAYGGFTKTEMEQWWKQHEGIDKRGYSENDVEDFTGCIPLLLKQCVKDGKINLTTTELRQIYGNSVGFTQLVKSTATDTNWEWYCDYVKACVRNEPVPDEWRQFLELIDHRYFYRDEDDIGRYTCGLVRDAVTNKLLELDVTFIDINFLNSLPHFIHNRSVVGFMMEYAILASIRSQGLRVGEWGSKGMELSFFQTQPVIQSDIRDYPVLYRPRQTNYKTIDGMIVFIKDPKRTAKRKRPILLLFPLQITVAKTHSNSYRGFLDEYRQWAEQQLSTFDIKLEFLWITPKKRDVISHPPDSPWPRHQERYIPFSEVSTDIWIKYRRAEKSKKKEGRERGGDNKKKAEEEANEEESNEEEADEEVDKEESNEEEAEEEAEEEEVEEDQRSGRITRSKAKRSRAKRSRAR